MNDNNQESNMNEEQIDFEQGYIVIQGDYTPETEETKLLKDNFGFFGPAILLYSVFYVCCMYKNDSGITFPIFIAGSILLLFLSLSKLNTILKKGSVFYIVAIMLLGISTFCTDDYRIIFLNKLGVFLLMMSLLLKQFFNTSNWRLGKYLLSICQIVVSSLSELDRPVSDIVYYREKKGITISNKVWYVLLGLIISIPVFWIMFILLTSADAVFSQIAVNFMGNIRIENTTNIFIRIVAVYFITYALTAFLCKRSIKENVCDKRKGEPALAITITGMLTLLYLLFSFVQIGGLFMGKMQLPEGYSYAMYAREGFFQLLAVSLINLVIVLMCMSYFRESKILKGVLAIMSLCTFIMIASSALRMIIYIRFYYLTYLRILVLWSLAVLTLIFIGVVLTIFIEKFPLFTYSTVVVTILYLVLSFMHPDYIIAKVNIGNAPHDGMAWWTEEEFEQAEAAFSQSDVFSGEFFLASEPYNDYYYLSTLSADAASVLIPYMEELEYDMEAFEEENAVDYADEIIHGGVSRGKKNGFGYYWLENMQEQTKNLGIRTFNLSRYLMVKRV